MVVGLLSVELHLPGRPLAEGQAHGAPPGQGPRWGSSTSRWPRSSTRTSGSAPASASSPISTSNDARRAGAGRRGRRDRARRARARSPGRRSSSCLSRLEATLRTCRHVPGLPPGPRRRPDPRRDQRAARARGARPGHRVRDDHARAGHAPTCSSRASTTRRWATQRRAARLGARPCSAPRRSCAASSASGCGCGACRRSSSSSTSRSSTRTASSELLQRDPRGRGAPRRPTGRP